MPRKKTKQLLDTLIDEIEVYEDTGSEELTTPEVEHSRIESHLDIEKNTDIKINSDGTYELAGDSYTSSYVSFIEFLLEENYINNEDIPIKYGQKRYIINTEKKHSDGDNMISPKKLADGIYVETNYNKEAFVKIIDYLIDKLGIKGEDSS